MEKILHYTLTFSKIRIQYANHYFSWKIKLRAPILLSKDLNEWFKNDNSKIPKTESRVVYLELKRRLEIKDSIKFVSHLIVRVLRINFIYLDTARLFVEVKSGNIFSQYRVVEVSLNGEIGLTKWCFYKSFSKAKRDKKDEVRLNSEKN